MYRCPKCNHQVDPSSPICPNCGERLFEQQGKTYVHIFSLTLMLIISILLTLCFGALTVLDLVFFYQYAPRAITLDYITLVMHILCFVSSGVIIVLSCRNKKKNEFPLMLSILTVSVDLLYVAIATIVKNPTQNVMVYLGMITISIVGFVIAGFMIMTNKYLFPKKVLVIVFGCIFAFSGLLVNYYKLEVSYGSDLYVLARNVISDVGIIFLLYGILQYRQKLIFRSRAVSEIIDADDNFLKENKDNNFEEVYNQLLKLKKLYDDGIITNEEYEEKRKALLDKLVK